MLVPVEELVGAVAFSTMIVRPGDTAVAIGVGDLPVLANSLIINAMQSAAIAEATRIHPAGWIGSKQSDIRLPWVADLAGVLLEVSE